MPEPSECGVGDSEFLEGIDQGRAEEVGQEVLGDRLDRGVGRGSFDESPRLQEIQEAPGQVGTTPTLGPADGFDDGNALGPTDHRQVPGGPSDEPLVSSGPTFGLEVLSGQGEGRGVVTRVGGSASRRIKAIGILVGADGSGRRTTRHRTGADGSMGTRRPWSASRSASANETPSRRSTPPRRSRTLEARSPGPVSTQVIGRESPDSR